MGGAVSAIGSALPVISSVMDIGSKVIPTVIDTIGNLAGSGSRKTIADTTNNN
jgi:hypothetical protein